MNTLKDKYQKYLELIKEHQDESGFIDHEHCDALLFSGLVGCDPNIKVDIDKARDEDGAWYRRPIDKPCFPNGSKSTISRDMLTGLLYYAYFNKRLDIVEGVIQYALKHKLIMGKAINRKELFGRCFMTPGLLASYAIVSKALGGPNRWWLTWIPMGTPTNLTGFQAHLAVLGLLIRKLATKSDKYDEKLVKYHKKQISNPLFAIAVGQFYLASKTLSNERLFPTDRLPTRGDRKESWLPQRDIGSDWEPAEDHKEKVHHGGDFIFCYWLMKKLMKK